MRKLRRTFSLRSNHFTRLLSFIQKNPLLPSQLELEAGAAESGTAVAPARRGRRCRGLASKLSSRLGPEPAALPSEILITPPNLQKGWLIATCGALHLLRHTRALSRLVAHDSAMHRGEDVGRRRRLGEDVGSIEFAINLLQLKMACFASFMHKVDSEIIASDQHV